MITGKVGSKGELFPPKSIREQMGLKKGQKVVYRVLNGRMIVEKYLELDEILAKSPKIEISFDEIKKDRKELSEEITNR
jgi:bifunctional DNA-binding transcriptional regulator/antitoxin component of YhaV-PrlF toxin-antitoxin module